jgi:hypothetical protein
MEIIGHKKIKNLLEKEIESGSFAQAYIFSGPKGVGKTTLAREFAQGLIWGKHFSALSPQERRDAEADIVLVSPVVEEKKGIIKAKEISIEQVLDARRELANFPYRGKVKVLIVEESDRLTIKAQNALLKITEEPNSTSIIILVTSRASKLLPTIQSRCRNINFGLVDSREMEVYLQSQGMGSNPEAITFSMGRPGIMLEMLHDPEKVAWARASKEKLGQALRGSLNEKLKLAEELSKNVPEAIRHLEFWLWELHAGSARENLFVAEKISEVINTIKNTNANARLILENLFINL